jgi:hypothetical protein
MLIIGLGIAIVVIACRFPPPWTVGELDATTTKPLPAALQRERIRSLKRGGCHEGVLSCLPRGDLAGCDLGDCSQQRAGTGGPGICHAPLHAGRRLVTQPSCSAKMRREGSRPTRRGCRSCCAGEIKLCGRSNQVFVSKTQDLTLAIRL